MSCRNKQNIVAMTLTEGGAFYAVPKKFTLSQVRSLGDGSHTVVLADGRVFEFNSYLPRWCKMNREFGGTKKDVRTFTKAGLTRSKKDRDRTMLCDLLYRIQGTTK